MVTSSAVVGSSAISSLGSQASAIAIITPLLLAAGHLVRIAARRRFGGRACPPRQQRLGFLHRLPARQAQVLHQRLDTVGGRS